MTEWENLESMRATVGGLNGRWLVSTDPRKFKLRDGKITETQREFNGKKYTDYLIPIVGPNGRDGVLVLSRFALEALFEKVTKWEPLMEFTIHQTGTGREREYHVQV